MVQMVPDSALCIYPEEVSSSRQPLKYLMTSSILTLNIRFSLLTSRKPFLSIWERMGVSHKTQSPVCIYLSFHLVCWPMYLQTIPPAWVPTRRPQGQWLLLDFMTDVWTSTHLSPSALHHQPQGMGFTPLSPSIGLGHPRSSPGSP